MAVTLRIPVTAQQEKMIVKAAKIAQADVATWLRPIVLQAAKDFLAAKKLARITPANTELRKLAKRFPPPAEWFAEKQEEPPF